MKGGVLPRELGVQIFLIEYITDQEENKKKSLEQSNTT